MVSVLRVAEQLVNLMMPSRENLRCILEAFCLLSQCNQAADKGDAPVLRAKPPLGEEQTDHLSSFLSRKRRKGRQKKKRRRESMKST